MAQGPSPLLGYNTNVRHKGKLYHIQTEDSGVQHPHIITHLFADGGRIIASKKTSYSEHLGVDDLKTVVKKLMQEQHKGMFIALRDGGYDDPADTTGSVPIAGAAASVAPAVAARAPVASPRVDVAALERAAARISGDAPTSSSNGPTTGRYQATQLPHGVPARPKSKPPESIFGGDLVSEKSLDEVILSYLASDLDENEG